MELSEQKHGDAALHKATEAAAVMPIPADSRVAGWCRSGPDAVPARRRLRASEADVLAVPDRAPLFDADERSIGRIRGSPVTRAAPRQ
jgi:hypothetical protein